MQSLVELILGVRVHISGDALLAHESSLILSNHGSTLIDALVMSSAVFHASRPTGAIAVRAVVADRFKDLPVIGMRK